MPSKTRRNILGSPFRVPFQSTIAQFAEYLQRAGLCEHSIAGYLGPVRHFLIWLDGAGTKVRAVDGGVVQQFLNHDCTCPLPHPMGNHARSLKSGRCVAPISWFVRFLEETGRTPIPGELDNNLLLLDAFMEHLAGEGYSPFTLAGFRFGCRHFIVWLHHHRVPIRHVDASVLGRFLGHHCICFVPGVFRGRSDFAGTRTSDAELKKFVGFLVNRGLIPEITSSRQTPDDGLGAFRAWLRQHRGINDHSIRGHTRNVAQLLTELGDDPARYDAALIRDVLLRHLGRVSRNCVKRMTISLRMYLRFLTSTGSCVPGLAGAIPTVPEWSLSALPRYIPVEDIERAIASCDTTTHKGLRDRAILLLLARLALRAGDVLNLRLSDIDWDNARLRVCGKARREAALPLPQDAGDALLNYITGARPRVVEQRVFLRVHAPYRPLSDSSTISAVVGRALDRAGVMTTGSRGAHLIRHSVATGLLRSGASLEVVGSLLRHTSSASTAIYAKVDTNMLRQVAQPWIGGGAQCR